jgi:hypothetical protein
MRDPGCEGNLFILLRLTSNISSEGITVNWYNRRSKQNVKARDYLDSRRGERPKSCYFSSSDNVDGIKARMPLVAQPGDYIQGQV